MPIESFTWKTAALMPNDRVGKRRSLVGIERLLSAAVDVTIDAAATADMLKWENGAFSIDASLRIAIIDRAVPSYFQSLEHLLRYWPPPLH